jgi:hypothetical protein
MRSKPVILAALLLTFGSLSDRRHLARTTASASANYSPCQAPQISSTHT